MSVRTSAPVVVATALLVAGSLTACGQATTTAACVPGLQPGSVTDTVTVLGAFGTEPVVNFPAPATTAVSQRTMLAAAEDRATEAEPGDIVSINYAMFDGETGKQIDGTPFDSAAGSAPMVMNEETSIPALYGGLLCTSPGDRIALAMTPEQGFGPEQNMAMGVNPESDLIMVIDVATVAKPASAGKSQNLPNGFPAVVTNEDGIPGIVLPPAAAPEEAQSAASIIGDGKKVGKDDALIAQVLTVDWETETVSQSTWAQGTPIMLGSEAQAEALRSFLTGHTVGSQVVVITVVEGVAQVNVVDILALAQAQQ